MGLIDKLQSRQAVVSVIGLGHAGLPLAVTFAKAGFRVAGVDVDRARVEALNRGESHIQDVPSEALALLIGGSPALSATTDYDAVGDADAVIICVPTPLGKTRDPDLSIIISATEEVAKRLHPEMLIVLESTTYPGTTEEVVLPLLEKSGGRQLSTGTDFFLAFAPERVDPGRTDWTIPNTPKVIGGVTQGCRDAAMALYGTIVQKVVPVSSPKTAEMVKLLENTFRATNIGLANEIAIICDRLGIDVWEVIDAAKTKPFGFMPFYPGPGLGGHCIPVDPQYLAWKMKTLDYTARFIQLADEVNLGMPLYWTSKVQDVLNRAGKPVKDADILVLGVSYKRDVADTRESPGLDIIDHLLKKGAHVTYQDAYVPLVETDSYRLASIDDLQLGLSSADCVVIVTDHSYYDWNQVRELADSVVDTRNALGDARSATESIAARTSGGPGPDERNLHRRQSPRAWRKRGVDPIPH